jgi:diguanylate cyclase (GGDEF)-like protein
MTRLRSLLNRGTIRARLAALTAVLAMVIASVMYFSGRSTSIDHQRAVVDNVAGRQPSLVQRYLAEVLLRSNGFSADPGETADSLLHTADALLDGGAVLAVQGNDFQIHVPVQTDPTVRAKLTEFTRLAHELVALGDRIAAERPTDPGYQADVRRAVALSHVTSNVGRDAVGRMTTLADRAVRANARRQILLAGVGILLALTLCWLLSRHIVRRLRSLAETAGATAAGDLTVRHEVTGADEISTLAIAFNNMANSLSGLVSRLEEEASRDAFRTELAEALDMADGEPEVHRTIEHAMQAISATTPMELLLADSSEAHLKRLAVHPTAGGPGCSVASPFGCVAVRRGTAIVFDSSEALNACPKLRGRASGPCSAVCVPVSFMGKSLGVMHSTGPEHQVLAANDVVTLTTLAVHAGSKIGTLRAFSEQELHATTDSLTGLINRRTMEHRLRGLIENNKPFALAMADLDRFKVVNDTYGHEGGDRALRLFARTVRETIRADDIVARYGGEEFVLVFPGISNEQAVELLDRLRVRLASAVAAGDSPTVTASFGVTDSRSGTTVDQIVRDADEALMVAKAEGRNRVVSSPLVALTPVDRINQV